MKNFTREKMALTNGVSINNRMVKEEDRNMIKMDIYEEYKTNIRVSRKIHRLLKDLKKDDESFNDILTKILREDGYL